MESLSLADARRASVAAQGLPRRRGGKPSARTLLDLVRRQGVLQIDSVNVLARAHYLPPFSRLGPYDTAVLDRLAYRDHALFEAWSHAASLVPVELWPAHAWRRREHDKNWDRAISPEFRAYADRVLAEVAERGPLAASELSDMGKRRGGGKWFSRSSGKTALEYHFGGGRLAVADRRAFERVYDLAERIIPAEHYKTECSEDEARYRLTRDAVGALGVATVPDIADYFRHKLTPTRRVLKELVAAGEVVPVLVEGWEEPAYAPAGLKIPKPFGGGVLLSPFDPLVWNRPRNERLFDFHYRIEIYVPAPKRIHGYYVLPFLLGDEFAARVDLKADRAGRTLRVFSAWHVAGPSIADTASALAAELAVMASWLGLDTIAVERKGDLAKALAAEVARA